MKKRFSLLLLTSLLLLCSACHPKNLDPYAVPSADVDIAIKQAFLDITQFDVSVEELTVDSRGCYDGAWVVYVDGPFGYMQSIRSKRIGGLTFHFGDSQEVYVYKDGEMKKLSQAYSSEWLSDEALKELHDAYW